MATQSITWTGHRECCPGCSKLFRTVTGYAWHLAHSPTCAEAHDTGVDPRKAPKMPKRARWSDKRLGDNRRAEMRKVRGKYV